jgi:hypothetical protein
VRNVVDEWTSWSSSVFDHNKQVTQLIEQFLGTFDGWQSRDVTSEIMKCDTILRTINIDTAASQRDYEPILATSQEKLKNTIAATKATIEKGKERAIAHRNLMISSEQFLQKERARLNSELQAEWKRNQEIFRQNQADLYAKFNVKPRSSSTELANNALTSNAIELVEAPMAAAAVSKEPDSSDSNLDAATATTTITSSDNDEDSAPSSTTTTNDISTPPENIPVVSDEASTQDSDSRIDSAIESS